MCLHVHCLIVIVNLIIFKVIFDTSKMLVLFVCFQFHDGYLHVICFPSSGHVEVVKALYAYQAQQVGVCKECMALHSL